MAENVKRNGFEYVPQPYLGHGPHYNVRKPIDREKQIAAIKAKTRGNYSIYKLEGDKESRVKNNLSHAEMSEHLRSNPEYHGGDGYGFGGRRTYPIKK